jgi:CRISPR/Cas system-associated endoribonuclease Cas2
LWLTDGQHKHATIFVNHSVFTGTLKEMLMAKLKYQVSVVEHANSVGFTIQTLTDGKTFL